MDYSFLHVLDVCNAENTAKNIRLYCLHQFKGKKIDVNVYGDTIWISYNGKDRAQIFEDLLKFDISSFNFLSGIKEFNAKYGYAPLVFVH